MRPWTDAGQKIGKAQGAINAPAKVRKFSGVQGYKLAVGGKSEQLGKSWTVAVQANSDGVVGEIGNNTSYAPWVQLASKQSRLHATRGWKTVDTALEESQDDINGFFADALAEWEKTFLET
jgi:hypothetical protein